MSITKPKPKGPTRPTTQPRLPGGGQEQQSQVRRTAPVTKSGSVQANKSPAPRADTKLERVIAMLRSPKGVTLDQLVNATEWQRHTVRGAISGAIKKKLGLNVISEARDGKRTYRIGR